VKERLKKLSKKEKIVLSIFVVFIIAAGIIFFKFFLGRFTTSQVNAQRCTPYGVEVVTQSTTEINIKWKTDENCIGFIKYGLSIEDLSYESVEKGTTSTTLHEIQLTKLQAGFTYYYLIVSDSKEYGVSGLPLSFSTKAF
jgi:hypothetical protein